MPLPSPDIELLLTSDGSSTLRLPTGETYRSRHGALQESQHVFIESGLKYCVGQLPHRLIRILEIGLGTGLNVLLTAAYAQQTPQVTCQMVSLEPTPIGLELVNLLHYPSLIGGDTAQYLQLLHTGPWNENLPILPNFNFRKVNQPLAAYQPTGEPFDLVYFDAFAPRSQPELWGEASFATLAQWLQPGSVLVTYCAQGQFRRNLRAVGFVVERPMGPPGKSEMTRAIYQP